MAEVSAAVGLVLTILAVGIFAALFVSFPMKQIKKFPALPKTTFNKLELNPATKSLVLLNISSYYFNKAT